MGRPTMTCKKCEGVGKVPMSVELERTLQLIVEGPKTTKELYDCEPGRITRPAINGRLEELTAEGLVTRGKGPGKVYTYTATAKGRRLTPTKRKPISGSDKT